MAAARTSPLIPLEQARTGLALLWFIATGIIVVLLVVRILRGLYYPPEQVQDVWGWVLPMLIPTLALMLSTLGTDAIQSNQSAPQVEYSVRRSFYQIAWWLSFFYLILIVISLTAAPYTTQYEFRDLELMRLSNLWLAPVQGLVVAALGVLFFSKTVVGQDE